MATDTGKVGSRAPYLPWVLQEIEDGKLIVKNAIGDTVASGVAKHPRSMVRDIDERDLGLIVRAVNAHDDMKAALLQYRDDLRHPPTAESRKRRLEMIDALLSRAEQVKS